MKNGTLFTAFTNKTVAQLQGIKVLDYYAQALPSELDKEMTQIVKQFLAATAVQQPQFQAALPKAARSLFGIFGHRAATLADRQKDVEMLQIGLVATTVANYEIPQRRRVEVGLAIFHHIARKLEQNPVDLFEAAAQIANQEMAELLLKFGKNSAVNIRNYGWTELKTEEGVKYSWG